MSGVKYESHLTEAKERNVSCVFDSSVFLVPFHFSFPAYSITNLYRILPGSDQIQYKVLTSGIKYVKIQLESRYGNSGNSILKY
jgi:hypothetical protein